MFGMRRQSAYVSASAGTSDPYFSNVVLLLKGDNQSNGSTTITDSSSYAKTPSTVVGTTVNTSIKKYGAGSIYLANQGSPQPYVQWPSSSSDWDFRTQWTIEFWLYRPTGWATNGNPNITYGTQELGNIGVTASQLSVYTGQGSYRANVSSITYDTWHHIAFTKTTGVNKPRFWLNGTEQTESFNDTWPWLYQNSATSQSYQIGRQPSSTSTYPNQYLDDFRITMGVARYTGTFTPPTSMPTA